MDFTDFEQHLRGYKYNQKSLEKMLNIVFNHYNVNHSVLTEKKHEAHITEITSILVEYKFGTKKASETIATLNSWFARNKNVFEKPLVYHSDDLMDFKLRWI